MKVIALIGYANSGKTATMNELVKLFPPAISSNKIQLGDNPDDFFVECSYNNQIVGIVSVGDDNGSHQMVQEPILRQYKMRNFDVIVCACRRRGSKSQMLLDTLFSGIDYVHKTKGASDDKIVASTIFSKI